MNGHQNADGPSDDHSWNCGWEGDQNVPPVLMTLRKRQVKNFCTLFFLSNGTPMFRAGDEFLQTQHVRTSDLWGTQVYVRSEENR